ncbi:MAG: extracellular solute-binding protein [Candidatus Riflebacteria bacterium]|nr:extracellular solute-binding protein [Candidatus Riflebacteria bacterium]
MKNNKTVFAALVSAFLAVCLFTGCQSGDQPIDSRQPIQIWLDANAREIEFFREIGGRIEKAIPGIVLHWKVTRLNDLKPTFLGHAQRTREPDIVLLVNDWIGELSRQNLLLPITASFSHIMPAMLDGVTVENKLYAVPWSFEALALFYNTDLVATPPRNFEELISIGAALGPNCLYPFIYENKNFYSHAPLFFGFGASIFAADGRIDLQTAEHENSLKFARDLQVRWNLLPAKANYPAMINLFGRGQIGMIISGPWSMPEIERSPVNFAVTRIPDISASQPARPFIGIKGFAVNAHTAHPREALMVVEMLGSQEIQSLAARRIGLLPCYQPVSGNQELTLHQQGFLDSARYGIPLPPGESMKLVWQETSWILNEVFNNPARGLSEVLNEAQSRIEQLEELRQ